MNMRIALISILTHSIIYLEEPLKIFIDDERMAELESSFDKNCEKITNSFNAFKEQQKRDDVIEREEAVIKKELHAIHLYNKKVDKLIVFLKRKIAAAELLHESELQKNALVELSKKDGVTSNSKATYSKEKVLLLEKKRKQILETLYKQGYKTILSMHDQLEKKTNTYYLTHTQEGLEKIYKKIKNMISQLDTNTRSTGIIT